MLALDGIRVTARDSDVALLAIDHLSLAAGDRLVVMGPSGAGKSLLLSALAGRIPYGLSMTGERASDGDPRIGFVPQRGSDALHPLLRIDAQLRRVSSATAAQVSERLRQVGIGDALHRRRPAELSGGQAQRAALAQAVLVGAPLIIADEPTSALDPVTRDEVLDLIVDTVPPQTSLVVSTHDPAVAERIGGRLLRLENGRVDGRPA